MSTTTRPSGRVGLSPGREGHRGRARNVGRAVAGVAAATLAGTVLSGTSAHAATGIILAQGIVQDAANRPATHAKVMLIAWPSNDVLDALKVGDSVRLQPLATTFTDAAGRYSLTVADESALAPFADRYGNVNVDIVAQGTNGLKSLASTPLDPDPASIAGRQQAQMDQVSSGAVALAAPARHRRAVAVRTMVLGSMGETPAQSKARLDGRPTAHWRS